MRTSVVTLALSASVLLSGCFQTFNGMLANRVSCTMDQKKAFYSSMYGWIGITSEVDSADTIVLCESGRKAVAAQAAASGVGK